MPDPIFERYKEALRAGHVAALRGRPDDALLQYRLAASIAPDRALPHVSMAEVLLRTGHADEALAACQRALDRAPGDEAALALAARLHALAGRAAEAAALLDRLADGYGAVDRAAEAYAAAVAARDLAPSEVRGRRVAELEVAAGASRGMLPASLRWTVGATPPGVVAAKTAASGESASAGVPAAAREPEPPPPSPLPLTPPELVPPPEPVAASQVAPAPELVPPPEPVAASQVAPAAAPTAATERSMPGAPARTAPDREASPDALPPARLDPEAAYLAAEELVGGGDLRGAARRYVEAAAAYLALGAVDTAVEACLRALSGTPDDTEVHLTLARIYAASGHPERARETLDLLERLLTLDADATRLVRLAAVRRDLLGMPGADAR
jgi:tetratricopeptide (TPR) repeat protein